MKNGFKETTDQINVEYVAHLARLELTEPERETYQRHLENILDYVKDLNSVKVDGVEPMAHPLNLVNVFRPDVPAPGLDRDAVLRNAPQSRNHQLVVPLIVE